MSGTVEVELVVSEEAEVEDRGVLRDFLREGNQLDRDTQREF